LPRPRRGGNIDGIVKRLASAVLLLALLGVAACGGESPSHEPLDAVERAAVGTYYIDLVHEVTEKQRQDLLAMEMVLRADRTFGWTRWVEGAKCRVMMTGTWRIEDGKLIRTATAYHSEDHPDMPDMTLPEPVVDEETYEDGAIRMWPHRPYLLRRVK